MGAFFLCFTIVSQNSQAGYIPKAGFVPDKETAEKIAEAVAIPIYGKEKIGKEKPLIAKLDGDKWTVTGTFHGNLLLHVMGGVVIVEISKTDGRIISVTHEK